jgi:hypothetical protein
MKNMRPSAPSLYTDVSWCGDRSGSMSSMGLSPQEGAETFMKDHKKLSNNRSSTTVMLKKSRIVTLKKREMLWFLVGLQSFMIQRLRAYLVSKSLPKETAGLMYENNHLVTAIFATFTDGMDNESIADASALKRAIDKHKSQYNATCMFLAANIDADTTGTSCGFDAGLCMQMGADRVSSGEALRICSIAMMRAASQQPPQFTQLERETSCRVTRPVNSAPSTMMQGPQRCVTGPSLRQPAPLIPPSGLHRQTNHRVSLRTPAV